VTAENGCHRKPWVAPWLAMVSCGCIVACGDMSGTRHHQLGGSYLPDRAAGDVHPDHHCGAPTFGISTKPAADICCCPSGSSLIESGRHGTTAHVLLLVSSWRSWPASLTAMSLAVVPSLYPH
jgi:hypothetical protein